MMYFSQTFKSPEVMDRVCDRLVQLGFRPSEIHASRRHVPCLFVSADWGRLQLIQNVVDAAVHEAPGELGDLWDRPAAGHDDDDAPAPAVPTSRCGSPIHWEPRESAARDSRVGLPLMERFDA